MCVRFNHILYSFLKSLSKYTRDFCMTIIPGLSDIIVLLNMCTFVVKNIFSEIRMFFTTKVLMIKTNS